MLERGVCVAPLGAAHQRPARLAAPFPRYHYRLMLPVTCKSGMVGRHSLLLALISVALIAESVAGQEPLLDDWRWARFALESGMIPSGVHLVAEATDGTMWVATSLGMTWFDGFEWQRVTGVSGDPVGISIVEPDHEGGIYVVSGGELFQGNQEGFQQVPIEGDGQPASVTSLAVGPDRLFINSGARLYQWANDEMIADPLMDELDSALHGLYAHGAWIVAWGSGTVWRWREGGWRNVFEFPPEAQLRVAAAGETLAIAELRSGESTVWTLDGGGEPVGNVSNRGLPALGLAVAENGDVVVTYEAGSVSARRNGRWAELNPAPVPLRSAREVEFDSAGDLWVVSEAGFFVNRSSLDRWSRWDDSVHSGGHRSANALASLPNGDIWGGTAAGLVVRHPDGSMESFSTILGRTLGPITGLIADRAGNLWVSSGADLEGALRFDGTEWTHFGADQGLLAPRVHRMALDREGRVWFLGVGLNIGRDQEPGAFAFDGSRFERWGEREGLIKGRVYAFAEGPDGARWFGTSGGLSRWLNGERTHWTGDDGIRQGRVFTLAIGSDGTVWFGHGPRIQGLGFISDEQVQYVPAVDATVNARVWDIQPASDGTLWLGTRAGLARVTQDGVKFFGRSGGMEHPFVWSVLPLDDRIEPRGCF